MGDGEEGLSMETIPHHHLAFIGLGIAFAALRIVHAARNRLPDVHPPFLVPHLGPQK